MGKYYIIVEVLYVNYETMERSKVKIKQCFNNPQENAQLGIWYCIKQFYMRMPQCDIISFDVIANALFE